eukprot:TRINITY_DN31271_c0_g1_i1.p1 TRINITY_DN31271_c0_g1~~TRINITY_DN31271_c0_g1_i1.p1  ORF type:complete len:482 (-),score=146.51 TRINITY_DN31271_c0_g1_i1:169-1614(-)
MSSAPENFKKERLRFTKIISKLQKDNEILKEQSTQHARSNLIQNLRSNVKEQEFLISFLKSELSNERNCTLSTLNESILLKTIGQPRRFEGKSREELEIELAAVRKHLASAKRAIQNNKEKKIADSDDSFNQSGTIEAKAAGLQQEYSSRNRELQQRNREIEIELESKENIMRMLMDEKEQLEASTRRLTKNLEQHEHVVSKSSQQRIAIRELKGEISRMMDELKKQRHDSTKTEQRLKWRVEEVQQRLHAASEREVQLLEQVKIVQGELLEAQKGINIVNPVPPQDFSHTMNSISSLSGSTSGGRRPMSMQLTKGYDREVRSLSKDLALCQSAKKEVEDKLAASQERVRILERRVAELISNNGEMQRTQSKIHVMEGKHNNVIGKLRGTLSKLELAEQAHKNENSDLRNQLSEKDRRISQLLDAQLALKKQVKKLQVYIKELESVSNVGSMDLSDDDDDETETDQQKEVEELLRKAELSV